MVDSENTDNDDNLEVLENKLKNVQNHHINDFGELILSNEIFVEFNSNITNPSVDKVMLYNDMIRRLYTTLIIKNLDNLDNRLDNRLKSRIMKVLVDFSEIIHNIQKTKLKMTKNHSIDDLNDIYMDDVKFLQNSYASKRNVLIGNVSIQVFIAVIGSFVGMGIQKIFNIF